MEKKYVSYRRLSKLEEGKRGLGLEAQTEIINRYYPNIEKDFVEVKSGATAIDRPILQEAIKYCKENEAILVVAKTDRLSRSVMDALTIFDLLKGDVRFCDIPGDKPERFVITLFFAIAERERELISIRIRAALSILKAQGKKLGLHMTHNKEGKPMDQDRLKKKEYKKMAGRAAQIAAEQNENNIRAKEYAEALRREKNTYDYIAHRLNNSKFASPAGGKWQRGNVHRLLNR